MLQIISKVALKVGDGQLSNEIETVHEDVVYVDTSTKDDDDSDLILNLNDVVVAALEKKNPLHSGKKAKKDVKKINFITRNKIMTRIGEEERYSAKERRD